MILIYRLKLSTLQDISMKMFPHLRENRSSNNRDRNRRPDNQVTDRISVGKNPSILVLQFENAIGANENSVWREFFPRGTIRVANLFTKPTEITHSHYRSYPENLAKFFLPKTMLQHSRVVNVLKNLKKERGRRKILNLSIKERFSIFTTLLLILTSRKVDK